MNSRRPSSRVVGARISDGTSPARSAARSSSSGSWLSCSHWRSNSRPRSLGGAPRTGHGSNIRQISASAIDRMTADSLSRETVSDHPGETSRRPAGTRGVRDCDSRSYLALT